MLLRSSDAPGNVVLPSEVSSISESNVAQTCFDLKKSTQRIAHLETTKKITVRRLGEVMEEVRLCHTEKIDDWKDGFRGNDDRFINDINILETNIFKPSFEWNFILVRFKKHVQVI